MPHKKVLHFRTNCKPTARLNKAVLACGMDLEDPRTLLWCACIPNSAEETAKGWDVSICERCAATDWYKLVDIARRV